MNKDNQVGMQMQIDIIKNISMVHLVAIVISFAEMMFYRNVFDIILVIFIVIFATYSFMFGQQIIASVANSILQGKEFDINGKFQKDCETLLKNTLIIGFLCLVNLI